MPGRDLAPVTLVVARIGEFFRIDPPDHPRVEGSLDTIMHAVFRLLGRWLVDEAADAPVLHAATAIVHGHRIVFVGDKGSGKTTLMLKLMQEGFGVEGDEHLVVTATGGITRPRRLHVKEGSLSMVPALSGAVRSSPSATDWIGNVVYACRPTLCGGRWEIRDVPVDGLVFLEPNFGGSAVLSPVRRDEAFGRLLETAFMPAANRAQAAARLRMLTLHDNCWRLQTGDLDQALRHLRRLTT